MRREFGAPRRLLRGAQRAVGALRQRRLRILAYHSVSESRGDPWAITPAAFESHLKELRRSGASFFTLMSGFRALGAGTLPARSVALTFDDGYVDFLARALPLLRDYAAPVTLHVPFGYVGGRSVWSATIDAPLLDWNGLDQAVSLGVELGAHGWTHCSFTGIESVQLAQELGQPLEVLRSRWGLTQAPLAYPFGHYGPREMEASRNAGYVCAVDYGGLWGNGRETHPFALARDAVETPADVGWLRRQLSGLQDVLRVLEALRAGGRSGRAEPASLRTGTG